MDKNYNINVFINCPFDKEYQKFLDRIIFTIYDCSFIPRCALEEEDGGEVRFEKINKLIKASRFSIHDLSRTEVCKETLLPRFNMPFELGVFIGAKLYGGKVHRLKNCLILDKERYRFQTFISDIGGQDIKSHDNKPDLIISKIRNWLNSASGARKIPGGMHITKRFNEFKKELPILCEESRLKIKEITYNDYNNLVAEWLKKNID